MAPRRARFLVVCKTYPSPSAKYAETSCVAAMEEDGKMLRLFPVPFRLISGDAQFKKWQWISARVEKSKNDLRPESHRLLVDTIKIEGKPVSPAKDWQARRPYIQQFPLYGSYAELESARRDRGVTLGFVRPEAGVVLEVTPAKERDWTTEELAKLRQLQTQAGLFDEEAKVAPTLRKVPYDFHYRYRSGGKDYRHKIVDWEIGALYWNVRRSHSQRWEEPLRAKIEEDLPSKDLTFLMGTMHRFPEQWLIVSLIYPPKQPELHQGLLL